MTTSMSLPACVYAYSARLRTISCSEAARSFSSLMDCSTSRCGPRSAAPCLRRRRAAVSSAAAALGEVLLAPRRGRRCRRRVEFVRGEYDAASSTKLKKTREQSHAGSRRPRIERCSGLHGGRSDRHKSTEGGLPKSCCATLPLTALADVELHHDKHHAAYVDRSNTTFERLDEARSGEFGPINMLEKNLAFHTSGHVLHSLLWKNMSPDGGGEPDGELAAAMKDSFGSFDAFRAQLTQAAMHVQGSGWARALVRAARRPAERPAGLRPPEQPRECSLRSSSSTPGARLLPQYRTPRRLR